MKINERIKELRKERGITLEALGKSVGVSKQTIARYESGEISHIPYDKIELLAKALLVEPSYLMGWYDTKPDLLKLGNAIHKDDENDALLEEELSKYITEDIASMVVDVLKDDIKRGEAINYIKFLHSMLSNRDKK